MQNIQPNQITDLDPSCKLIETSKLSFTLFLILYFVFKAQRSFSTIFNLLYYFTSNGNAICGKPDEFN